MKILYLLGGYNILHKEISEGVLLLPSVIVKGLVDKTENPWNNYVGVGVGPAYIKGPFSIGADVGYLKGFNGSDREGPFVGAWSNYWKQWDLENLSESNQFPMRPQIITSGSLEASTLTQDLEFNGRVEGGIVVFEKDNFKILPYAAISGNGDVKNYSWDDYLRGTGGLRLTKGPFSLFIEGDYQQSLNGGKSGAIFSGGAGLYFAINE